MDRRIREALALLEHRWHGAARVPELAAQLGLGVSHLEHLFKREVSMTISGFIRERRLAEAARLLSGTEQRVCAISLAAGFPDLSNFNHAFKKRFGLSPREYRARARRRVSASANCG